MKYFLSSILVLIIALTLTACSDNSSNATAANINRNLAYEILGTKREQSVIDANDMGFCVNLHVKSSSDETFQFNVFAIYAKDDTGISILPSLFIRPAPAFDPNIRLAPSAQHRGWICFSEPEPSWTPTTIEFSEFARDTFLRVIL